MSDEKTSNGSMTDEQRELARHALGLPNARHTSYRNHFVAGEGHSDFENWLAMVSAGLASRRKGSELTGGDDLFRLTRSGAEIAIKKREKLCTEDFPKAAT